MIKTPVSILQEMMVKKGSVPNYELIHDGGGSHENTFTYRVTCEGLLATGTGRCKKDAKHAAASNMLEAIVKHNGLLPLPASPAKSPVRAPPPQPKPEPYLQDLNGPFVNAIGALQDLCADNDLQGPVYNTTSDVGPPHARVFTIECAVASFKEEGVSTTKKQAKHLAAKKMLQRISDVLDDASKSSISFLKMVKPSELEANERAKKIFLEQKALLPKKVNLGVKLADYPNRLRSIYAEDVRKNTCEKLNELASSFSDLLRDCGDVEDTPRCAALKESFEELLKPLNIDVCEGVINNRFQVVSLDTTPEIVESYWGDEPMWKVQMNVYLRIIKHLKMLLS
ncbi:probable RISC-loading complex subunit BRAFLDRAFT_242885 isoform X2 [Fopius arisanus]|nr:PREDICTED: probable RISC-loading complex subunit BRAFLDRAFT_242885 isoform X2 [Fopius arisanus]